MGKKAGLFWEVSKAKGTEISDNALPYEVVGDEPGKRTCENQRMVDVGTWVGQKK